jgi:hypothetical protein
LSSPFDPRHLLAASIIGLAALDDENDALTSPGSSMSANQTNATAGPSSQPDLFLLPWQCVSHVSPAQARADALSLVHPVPPKPSTHIRGTQDLVTRLGLLGAYDRHVRAHAVPLVPPLSAAPGAGPPMSSISPSVVTDKGKGKEREASVGLGVANAPTPGGPVGDGADEEGRGEKKRKNTYRHLIKGIPGMPDALSDPMAMSCCETS